MLLNYKGYGLQDPKDMHHSCEISVITVTYRSSLSAAETLRTNAYVLSRFSDVLEWIIIDNTEDGSDAAFIQEFSHLDNIKLLRRPDNPGFAGACNLGARASQARWLVFLNPDVTLDVPGFEVVVRRILEARDERRTYAVGQVTNGVYHQGIDLLLGVWFADHKRGSRRSLIAPSGGLGVYPRELFVQFDGFPEKLFAWGEDADLGLRMKESGVPCEPVDVFFLHSGGHVHANDERLERKKAWLLSRNRQLVARKRFPIGRWALFQLVALGVIILKAPVHARRGTLGAVLWGNLDGLTSNAGTRRYDR